MLPDRTLVQLALKVGLGDLDEAVEEVEREGRINVALRAAEDRDVVVSCVNEAHTRQLDYRSLFCSLCCDDFVAKVHYLVATVTKRVRKGW